MINQSNNVATVQNPPEIRGTAQISPQTGVPISEAPGKSSCRGMGSMLNDARVTAYSYVYALGRIMARFPTMGVEKEFVQATGRTGKDTTELTDQETFHSILSKPENRYLVRKMCWVLTTEGIDTYILQPRDPADYDLLVEAIRPVPSPIDIDVVIGIKGPIAPPEMCKGLVVPIVAFDQIYSFVRPKLIEALKVKRPENNSGEDFTAAEELLDTVMQMSDNAGATDEHRALNYLIVRCNIIYAKTAEMHGRNFSLTAVEVQPSSLSGVRKIVDVIFSYTKRETDFTEKSFVRVDVEEEFPFLAGKLSPYLNRGYSSGEQQVVSAIRGGPRGPGLGGLNLWNYCWMGDCCVEWRWEAGPTGWQRVCVATKPCEYCLFPW